MKRKIQRRRFLRWSRNGELSVTNDKARHAYLCAHVKKLSDDAFHEMGMRQHASRLAARSRMPPSRRGLKHVRQVCQLNEHCNQDEDASDHQIGTLHRVDFRGVIGLELSGTHRGELRRSIFDTCEYGRSTENTGEA